MGTGMVDLDIVNGFVSFVLFIYFFSSSGELLPHIRKRERKKEKNNNK